MVLLYKLLAKLASQTAILRVVKMYEAQAHDGQRTQQSPGVQFVNVVASRSVRELAAPTLNTGQRLSQRGRQRAHVVSPDFLLDQQQRSLLRSFW